MSSHSPGIWADEKPDMATVKKCLRYANILGHSYKIENGLEVIKFPDGTADRALRELYKTRGESPFMAWPTGCIYLK